MMIIFHELEALPKGTCHVLPSYEATRKSIRNVRNKNYSPEPTSHEARVVSHPLNKTKNDDH